MYISWYFDIEFWHLEYMLHLILVSIVVIPFVILKVSHIRMSFLSAKMALP